MNTTRLRREKILSESTIQALRTNKMVSIETSPVFAPCWSSSQGTLWSTPRRRGTRWEGRSGPHGGRCSIIKGRRWNLFRTKMPAWGLKAAFRYFDGEELDPETLTPQAFTVFCVMRPYIDESIRNYEESVANGRKGAEERWGNETA